MSNDPIADDALPPVSPDSPCGPDLDAEGDSDFLNFMLATESELPEAFFAFDRKQIDFPEIFKTGDALLKRTHDVRLLTLLAKMSILNRDLAGFSTRVAMIARLLSENWAEAHPRGENGDYISRIQQLSTLEDSPVVLLPLQDAPLAATARDGAVTFRAQRIALGEINPREKEKAWTTSAVDKVLMDADLDQLRDTSATLLTIKGALERIKAVSIEKAGFKQAVTFPVLSPLVDRMVDVVQGALVKRDPSAAPSEAAAAPGEPAAEAAAAPAAGPLANLIDCDAALGAALGYFAKNEPSSPAVLLVGQARALLGKNLHEVLKVLAPAYVEDARIFVGGEPAFNVPVSSMPAQDSAGAEAAEIEPAASRAAALALLDQVAAHLRKAEPSSPAPYLLDRAKTLAARDFLSLLKDLLPEDALSRMKGWN